MASVNGRKHTCDRCGLETFCRCIGEGEMDGGYTRWNKFEAMPDGWERHAVTGILCPECNRQYKAMMTEFIGRLVE